MAPLLPAISRYFVAALANQGVVLRIAPLVLGACLVSGCEADDAPEPLCNKAAYFSSMSLDLPGFDAQYEAELPLLLDACPLGTECETVRVRPPVDPAELVECRSEPGSYLRCSLNEDGALSVQFMLVGATEDLEGEHELALTLRREDGTPFAEANTEVRLDFMYGRGFSCGPSHAHGRVEVDARAWSAVP